MEWPDLPDWTGHAIALTVLVSISFFNMRVRNYRIRCRDLAATEKASAEAGRTIYPIGHAYRRAVYGIYTLFASFAVAPLILADVAWYFAIAVYPMAWLMLSVELESPLTVSQRGVERTWLFGAIRRRIDWTDFGHAVVDYKKVEGERKPIIEVWAKDDSKRIVHTYRHVDQRRFLAEMRARGKVYGAEEDLAPLDD